MSSPWLVSSLEYKLNDLNIDVVPDGLLEDNLLIFNGIYVLDNVAFVRCEYPKTGILCDIELRKTSGDWEIDSGTLVER